MSFSSGVKCVNLCLFLGGAGASMYAGLVSVITGIANAVSGLFPGCAFARDVM